jgi:hypothetical protein
MSVHPAFIHIVTHRIRPDGIPRKRGIAGLDLVTYSTCKPTPEGIDTAIAICGSHLQLMDFVFLNNPFDVFI